MAHKLLMVAVSEQVKKNLDKSKVHHRETYNDVIERLLQENGKKKNLK